MEFKDEFALQQALHLPENVYGCSHACAGGIFFCSAFVDIVVSLRLMVNAKRRPPGCRPVVPTGRPYAQIPGSFPVNYLPCIRFSSALMLAMPP